MVNLLSRSLEIEPFPGFDARQRARFSERAEFVIGLDRVSWDVLLSALPPELSLELEEMEAAPSLEAGEAIVARIDAWRRERVDSESSEGTEPDGLWIVYRPGRSLGTGVAEIASRGFFDVDDRPPLALWIEAIARRCLPNGLGSGRPAFEISVLSYVPRHYAQAALRGCRACDSGALILLEDFSAPLAVEIQGLCD